MRPFEPIPTCEHATNAVPRAWRPLFRGRRALLESHRGWDPGARELARDIGRRFGVPVTAAGATRLLVDPNRSVHNPRVFSEVTRGLDAGARRALLERRHAPHRARVLARVERALERGRRALHVAVHSFTPRLSGRVRRADVGLLYDPARGSERAFVRRWRLALLGLAPELVVRRNFPYRGSDDGLTTALRREFSARDYLGLELEVNQRHLRRGRPAWRRLRALLVQSLAAAADLDGRTS